MTAIAHYERMFEHAHWANRKVARALQDLEGKTEKSFRWFAHILGSEKVWLTRLHGQDSNALPIWPELSVSECESLLLENHEGYRSYLSTLKDADLLRLVDYRNQTGAAYRTSIHDILTHVCMHGSYHRGQIASSLRDEGVEPVGTDYILFTRE